MNSSADRGDEEIRRLVLSFQNGDEYAFEQLCCRYQNLLNKIVRDYSHEYDELYSVAQESFCRAAKSYDVAKKDVTFGLYAEICVNNAMIDCVRKSRRIPLVSDCNVDDIAVSDGVQRRLEREEESAEFYSRVKGILSNFEYSVFELWMQGYKTAEISDKLAVIPKRVDNAKARMWRRLRAQFGSKRKN